MSQRIEDAFNMCLVSKQVCNKTGFALLEYGLEYTPALSISLTAAASPARAYIIISLVSSQSWSSLQMWRLPVSSHTMCKDLLRSALTLTQDLSSLRVSSTSSFSTKSKYGPHGVDVPQFSSYHPMLGRQAPDHRSIYSKFHKIRLGLVSFIPSETQHQTPIPPSLCTADPYSTPKVTQRVLAQVY